MTIGNQSTGLPEAGFEVSTGILDGLAYLRQCLAQKRGFGVIVGSTKQHRKKLIDGFADGLECMDSLLHGGGLPGDRTKDQSAAVGDVLRTPWADWD